MRKDVLQPPAMVLPLCCGACQQVIQVIGAYLEGSSQARANPGLGLSLAALPPAVATLHTTQARLTNTRARRRRAGY